MTSRQARKFRILQLAAVDALDCETSVVERERGLERLSPI